MKLVARLHPDGVVRMVRDEERLMAARRELEAARQALPDLEEEARRAGVPPGWTRE